MSTKFLWISWRRKAFNYSEDSKHSSGQRDVHILTLTYAFNIYCNGYFLLGDTTLIPVNLTLLKWYFSLIWSQTADRSSHHRQVIELWFNIYLPKYITKRTPESLTKYSCTLHHATAGIPVNLPQTVPIALTIFIFFMEVFNEETQLLSTTEKKFRLSRFSNAC